MNEPTKDDFFGSIAPDEEHLAAPEIYQGYQNSDEDRLHETRLKKLLAQIDEENGDTPQWGELPFDEQDDNKRWAELEKDFERVFEKAVILDKSSS